MLKENNNCEYEVDNGKYTELLPLYNAWHKRTCIMSVGNTTVPEWYALLNYCKQSEHHLEVLEFFLDLVDMRKKEYDEGINGSEYIGFFLDILDKCFPGLYTCEGYVNPLSIQKMYVIFARLALAPTAEFHLSEETIKKYMFNEEKIQ